MTNFLKSVQRTGLTLATCIALVAITSVKTDARRSIPPVIGTSDGAFVAACPDSLMDSGGMEKQKPLYCLQALVACNNGCARWSSPTATLGAAIGGIYGGKIGATLGGLVGGFIFYVPCTRGCQYAYDNCGR